MQKAELSDILILFNFLGDLRVKVGKFVTEIVITELYVIMSCSINLN